MVIKSKRQQINNNFKIGGLIFDSEEDYCKLKNIDNNINEIVKLVNDKIISVKDAFKNIEQINVKESYFQAREELDGLFKNSTSLLAYEGTRYINEYKVGCRFFDKIKVIKYFDFDSFSDSDSDF